MKNVIDIVDRVYQVINVTPVKATINGSIYKNGQPEKIQDAAITQNITINPLTNLNTPVGNSVCNINIYVPDLANGTPDTVKLNTIFAAVKAVLQAYESNTDYFNIDMDTLTTRVIRDEQNLSFLNLRFEVLTD